MNTVKCPPVKKLKLSDGCEWNFISTKDTRHVVEKAALLMGLSDSYSRDGTSIIFILGDPRNKQKIAPEIHRYPELHHLPLQGWNQLYLGQIRLWTHSAVPDIICEVNDENENIHEISRIYLSLLPLYNQVVNSGGFSFHAGMIEYGGKAVLITANSGTGKSTCCRRIPAPWKVLCDDETLIVRTGQGYRAHPFPTWSAYMAGCLEETKDVQQSLPIAAIFFLEQAKIDQALPIKDSMAVHALYSSAKHLYYKFNSFLSSDELYCINKKMFENACELSKTVPVFKLRATLDGKFWEEMAKVL